MEMEDESAPLSMNDTEQEEPSAAPVAMFSNRRESASLFLFRKESGEGDNGREETEEDIEARERDRELNQQKCGPHALN